MADIIYYPLKENNRIISNLFGEEFLKNMINDKLDTSECIAANDYLAEYLYGPEIAKLLKNNDAEGIMRIVGSLKEKYKRRESLAEDIDFSNIGLVVVRPENIGLVDKYVYFLEKKGLSLFYKKKIQISFEQYLLMYHHGLIPKESRYDFPTRTLNYINKDCYVLLFHSNKYISTADYLNSIKGKQGKFQSETLRGDIAYNGLKKILENNGVKFIRNEYNLFFDPIGMCRLLVRGDVESDNAHNVSDLKLLYYVGQAVHVPNSREIKDDFSVLFDENDIDHVQEKILKIKNPSTFIG